MRIVNKVEIIETSFFTKWVQETLDDVDYAEFQQRLIDDPEVGKLIPGGHGLRKVRMALPGKGKGKRGGARVIYYWIVRKHRIYLLLGYEKAEQESLSLEQMKDLLNLIQPER